MWQNSLGHCVLKAEFPKGKKELAVSLFQVGLFIAIALLFVNSPFFMFSCTMHYAIIIIFLVLPRFVQF